MNNFIYYVKYFKDGQEHKEKCKDFNRAEDRFYFLSKLYKVELEVVIKWAQEVKGQSMNWKRALTYRETVI